MIDIQIVNKSNNANPSYAKIGDAGMDIRAFITPETSNVGDTVYKLAPHSRALIHTGIYVKIAESYQIEVRPRSGLAYKQGVTVLNSPGTIDENYIGEVGVILINHSDEYVTIRSGDRIAQIVLMPSPKINWIPVKELGDTERGQGGFGSTGKN